MSPDPSPVLSPHLSPGAPRRIGRRALLAAPLLALLGACGLKGPLTLPERGEGNVVIRDPGAPPAAEPAPPAPPDPPR